MKQTLTFGVLAVALLSGCGLVEVTEDNPDTAVQQSSSAEPVRETQNVTYTGEVQPAGISIYQQGSHRLVLPGGKFILLEAETLDLNGYVGERVQVYGALRPTVEAGGMIMRVETIELMDEASESSSDESSAESTASSENSSVDSEVTSSDAATTSSQSTSQANTSDDVMSSSSEASSESSEATSEPSEAFTQNLEVMARQDYSATNWTQQYCSSHVGFCVPVHRNFWFKSFGATESHLWHVEFSAEPVESLGDGPIVLELRAGSMTEADGTVDVTDTKAMAYKEWTFGRHFVIHADPQLETAVRYMMENITEFTQ